MSNREVIDPDEFLKCVKRTFSLSDTLLARCLGVGRSSVWRFKRKPKNKPIVDEAKAYLASFNEDHLQPKTMTYEVFRNTLAIRKWEEAMERRMVGKTNQNGWMRCFYNLCKYLNRLPGKVTVEECAKVVVEQRNRYYNDEPQVKGIAYSKLREAVRGYYMSVHNMSGMHLTNLGVGKEALKGSGKYSRQLVPQEVRHEFERLLLQKMKENNDLDYFEALGNSRFNFSTGTRISASLAFSFSKHEFKLSKDKWMFEIWDKGTRGKKLRWEKLLMGSLLEDFKKYCSQRFEIPFDDLEAELPKKTDHLFPAFINDNGEPDTNKIRSIVKPTLIEAGIPYREFPPTHIWRHTFAQEALKATDYNYELVAEIGGWVTTLRLKKHYGAMGQSAKERALLKMMGETIPDVTHELEW
jgi:hypothetical protein